MRTHDRPPGTTQLAAGDVAGAMKMARASSRLPLASVDGHRELVMFGHEAEQVIGSLARLRRCADDGTIVFAQDVSP